MAKKKDVFIETVKFEDGTEIKCYDLHYFYLKGCTSGDIIETKEGIVEDATDLSMDEVMLLRGHQIDRLYAVIVRLTYPDLFDENGERIPATLEDAPDSDSPKKA